MAYLIIFLAMFLVIGPVIWLRPSKREREQAALRQVAIKDGARIQPISLRRDPVYSGILERNPHIDEHVWYRYQWVAREKEKGPFIKDSWIQRKDKEQGLVWEPRDVHSQESESIKQILEAWRQTQDVRFLALELGPRNVAIVWNEKGSQEELAALGEKVRALMQS